MVQVLHLCFRVTPTGTGSRGKSSCSLQLDSRHAHGHGEQGNVHRHRRDDGARQRRGLEGEDGICGGKGSSCGGEEIVSTADLLLAAFPPALVTIPTTFRSWTLPSRATS
jgi:hypothetical protein